MKKDWVGLRLGKTRALHLPPGSLLQKRISDRVFAPIPPRLPPRLHALLVAAPSDGGGRSGEGGGHGVCVRGLPQTLPKKKPPP